MQKINLTEELKKLEEITKAGDDSKESALQILDEICNCIRSLEKQLSLNERKGYELEGMIKEIEADKERIDQESDMFTGAKTIADAWITDLYDLLEGLGF